MGGWVQQAIWDSLCGLQDAEANSQAERGVVSRCDRKEYGGVAALPRICGRSCGGVQLSCLFGDAPEDQLVAHLLAFFVLVHGPVRGSLQLFFGGAVFWIDGEAYAGGAVQLQPL